MKPKVLARPPKPAKPARLTFAQIKAIPVPADCPFESLPDLELIDRVPAPELAALLVKWEERNQTDGDAAIGLSDVLVAATIRWRLRGMDIDLAIRKTRTDECYQRELRETAEIVDRVMDNPLEIEKPILRL